MQNCVPPSFSLHTHTHAHMHTHTHTQHIHTTHTHIHTYIHTHTHTQGIIPLLKAIGYQSNNALQEEVLTIPTKHYRSLGFAVELLHKQTPAHKPAHKDKPPPLREAQRSKLLSRFDDKQQELDDAKFARQLHQEQLKHAKSSKRQSTSDMQIAKALHEQGRQDMGYTVKPFTCVTCFDEHKNGVRFYCGHKMCVSCCRGHTKVAAEKHMYPKVCVLYVYVCVYIYMCVCVCVRLCMLVMCMCINMVLT